MKVKALVTLCAVLLCGQDIPAMAQSDQVMACQYTEAAGFNWKNEKWDMTGFYPNPPFFLKSRAGRLIDPPTKVVGPHPICTQNMHVETCHDREGEVLIFNHNTLRGSTASLYGSIQSDTDPIRASMSVSLFFCEKM